MDDYRGEPETYGFGSFRLEPHRRRLLCRGTPVALAPKLFDLLCLLVRGRGRVVARAHIVEAVWSDGVVSDTNLRQKVWLLRGALSAADPSGGDYVATVPRLGYRLAATVTAGPAPTPPPAPVLALRPGPPPGRAVSMSLWGLPLLLAIFVCSPHDLRALRTTRLAAADGQSVTLLPLRSHPGQDRDAGLASALTELLHAELAAVERLRLGTDLVVAGSLVAAGPGPEAQLSVHLLVHCTRSREVLAAVTRIGRRRDLAGLASDTAREVLSILGARAGHPKSLFSKATGASPLNDLPLPRHPHR